MMILFYTIISSLDHDIDPPTIIELKDCKKEKIKLKQGIQLKKIEENVEGIEFVVPRNRNQALVVRNFLSENVNSSVVTTTGRPNLSAKLIA